MKLKNVFELIGLKKPARQYAIDIREFPIDGAKVRYAQWLHPEETAKVLNQADVDGLRKYLSEGDVAIDIGAHTGDTTLPIALAAGKTGRVLALEPNPYVFKVLAQNARLNPDTTRIEPLCFAATEEDGPIEFEYSDPGYCNGGRHENISKWKHGCAYTLTVTGRNLTSYLRNERPELLSRLRYIKVDAEGYDATILRTLLPLLREIRPILKVEFYKHAAHSKRAELWELLNSLRYELYRVGDEAGLPQEHVALGDVSRWQHFDAVCFPAAEQARKSA